MGLTIGIDTSCYTSSVAVVDMEGNLIASEKRLLTVEQGNRGLRQSEALFQHMKNIPELVHQIKEKVDLSDVTCVSVSSRPRPVEGSYMPVFMGGMGFGSVMADVLKVPLYQFSHQEGHIMAGLWSAKVLHWQESEFLAFHISGGTTELLKVLKNKRGFRIEIIGGSKDLHAGQFVDRVGVSLGLPFPCGPHLEKIALTVENGEKIPVSVHGTWIHFSGPETHAQRIIKGGAKHENIARGVFDSIAVSVERAIKTAVSETAIHKIVMVGGVCSNRLIKKYLMEKLEGQAHIAFAEPEFSTDNAVGTALLGMKGVHR